MNKLNLGYKLTESVVEAGLQSKTDYKLIVDPAYKIL